MNISLAQKVLMGGENEKERERRNMICKYVNNERWIVNCNYYYDVRGGKKRRWRELLINVYNGASNNALMIIVNATKNYEKIINGFEH